jgi:hypothetical protein
MLTTLELRWFSHGTSPPEVQQWFNNDCPGKPLGLPEEREDLYLYTPECDYLNIKLRQGSLEVKWHKAELGIVRFGDSWEGKVEKWLKWVCKDPEQQSIIPAEVVGKGPWIAVKKKRSQRLYQGVAYELTQLSVKEDDWWSIAFEMAGEKANQIDSFKGLVSAVSQTYQGSQLLANHSYAYPRWLSRVARPS